MEDGQLFHFHENPSRLCPVGKNIHTLLDIRLEEIQKAMEREMKSISLQDIMNDAKKLIEHKNSRSLRLKMSYACIKHYNARRRAHGKRQRERQKCFSHCLYLFLQ